MIFLPLSPSRYISHPGPQIRRDTKSTGPQTPAFAFDSYLALLCIISSILLLMSTFKQNSSMSSTIFQWSREYLEKAVYFGGISCKSLQPCYGKSNLRIFRNIYSSSVVARRQGIGDLSWQPHQREDTSMMTMMAFQQMVPAGIGDRLMRKSRARHTRWTRATADGPNGSFLPFYVPIKHNWLNIFSLIWKRP